MAANMAATLPRFNQDDFFMKWTIKNYALMPLDVTISNDYSPDGSDDVWAMKLRRAGEEELPYNRDDTYEESGLLNFQFEDEWDTRTVIEFVPVLKHRADSQHTPVLASASIQADFAKYSSNGVLARRSYMPDPLASDEIVAGSCFRFEINHRQYESWAKSFPTASLEITCQMVYNPTDWDDTYN